MLILYRFWGRLIVFLHGKVGGHGHLQSWQEFCFTLVQWHIHEFGRSHTWRIDSRSRSVCYSLCQPPALFHSVQPSFVFLTGRYDNRLEQSEEISSDITATLKQWSQVKTKTCTTFTTCWTKQIERGDTCSSISLYKPVKWKASPIVTFSLEILSFQTSTRSVFCKQKLQLNL